MEITQKSKNKPLMLFRPAASMAIGLMFLFALNACGILKGGDEEPSTNKSKNGKEAQAFSSLSDGKKLKFDNEFFDAIKERQIGNNERAIKHFNKCRSIYEYDPAVHYQLGKIYLDEGNLDTALYFAKKAVKYGEDQYWYQHQLAEIYERKEAYGDAAKTYNQIIEQRPDMRQNYYKLSNMYLRQKKLQKAVDVYDRYEQRFGMDPEVSLQKHRIYLQMNKVEKAASEIKRLIEVHPSNMEYYQKLAKVYMVNNMEDKAFEVYEKMLDEKPGNGEAQMALAGYYSKKGKKDKAFDYLKKAFGNANLGIDQKVKFLFSRYLSSGFQQKYKEEAFALAEILVNTHPKEAKAHAVYGDFLYQGNNYEKARKYYRNALQYKKDIFSVWENLLDIEYRHLQDYEALLEESKDGMAYFPNQPILYFYKGFANMRMENFQQAIDDLKAGIDLSPGNKQLETQFLTNIAEAYHQLGEHEKSDQYFEKAMKSNPNNPLILNNYSYYLSLRGEKLERAEEMSKKSLRLAPNNSAYMDTYGWINYKQGDYEEAKEYIGKSLEQNPKDPELLEHYGDVLFKMNKVKEAVKYWKKALKNGGDAEKLNSKIQNRQVED